MLIMPDYLLQRIKELNMELDYIKEELINYIKQENEVKQKPVFTFDFRKTNIKQC